VRMRILFYGDRRRRTIACFVDHSLPSFFLPPLPCLAVALVDGGGESTSVSAVFFFLYSPPLPTFLFAAGRCIICSIVLNSLSQRHDNLYLSSKTNVLALSRGAICTFSVPFYHRLRRQQYVSDI
jgi:hypothetical protein